MPVNGQYYSWEDLTVLCLSGPQIDLTEISYDHEREVEHVYGQGAAPRGAGRGNFKGEGKLKMKREQYNLLLAFAVSQSRTIYTIAPFAITAAYGNDDQGLSTDQLLRCRFKKVGKKAAQGDKSIDVELDYIFEDIEEIGVTPQEAIKARYNLIFYRNEAAGEDTDIPAGALAGTIEAEDGSIFKYQVLEDAILPAGETEIQVLVEATAAGASYNVGQGLINQLYSSIPGIDGVKNDQADAGLVREGADAESEDRLKLRCRNRWASFSYGGTREVYIYHALTADPSVQRVTVNALAPRGDGTVDVIFTTTSPDGLPSVEVIAIVQIAIDAVKPCEADVLAKGPTPMDMDLVLAVVQSLDGGDADTIKEDVETAAESLFLPSDASIVYDIGDDGTRGKIFAVCMPVSFVGNLIIVSPASDMPVSADGLARLNSLSVEVS